MPSSQSKASREQRAGESVAYVGLGSNLGCREHILRGALRDLDSRPGITVARVSSFIETEPVGGPRQGQFINAAAALHTTLSPERLLRVLQKIEELSGRERSVRWGPRTLDLDLLLYDEEIVKLPDLQIPHPLMHERRFVLGPLCEIAPDAVHPVLGRTIRRLLSALPGNRPTFNAETRRKTKNHRNHHDTTGTTETK